MNEQPIEIDKNGLVFLYKDVEEGAYILGVGRCHEYAEVSMRREHMLSIKERIEGWLDE